MPLAVTVLPQQESSVVRLAGELDLAEIETFERRCAKLDGDVVVDLRDVDFLDASGVGALLRLRSRLTERHGTLRVTGAQPRVQRVLSLLSLEKTLHVESTHV